MQNAYLTTRLCPFYHKAPLYEAHLNGYSLAELTVLSLIGAGAQRIYYEAAISGTPGFFEELRELFPSRLFPADKTQTFESLNIKVTLGAHCADITAQEIGCALKSHESSPKLISLFDRGESEQEISRELADLKAARGISPQLCEQIMEQAGLLNNIRIHTRAVALRSLQMAERLIEAGIPLNIDLIASSALLHDIKKLSAHHELAGAEYIGAMGYTAVAKIISEHDNLENREIDELTLNESTLVFLADKIVRENECVTIEDRYAPAFERYHDDKDFIKRIKQDLKKLFYLKSLYEKATGEDLYLNTGSIVSGSYFGK